MSEQDASLPSLAETFSDCETADVCVWKALTRACAELDVQAGTFFELDATGASLRVAHTFGILPWRVAKGHFPVSQGICGWVSRQREPAIVNDVSKDARFNGHVDLVTQFKTLSVLCIPVMEGNRLYGVMELINRQMQPFTSSDLARLQPIVEAAAARLRSLSA